jgi:hypothetical protein
MHEIKSTIEENRSSKEGIDPREGEFIEALRSCSKGENIEPVEREICRRRQDTNLRREIKLQCLI